jgi:hypothetical protein
MLDRRSFLGSMVGGVAVAAAVRTWPFRVYSFPTDIVLTGPIQWAPVATLDELIRQRFDPEYALVRKRGLTAEDLLAYHERRAKQQADFILPSRTGTWYSGGTSLPPGVPTWRRGE